MVPPRAPPRLCASVARHSACEAAACARRARVRGGGCGCGGRQVRAALHTLRARDEEAEVTSEVTAARQKRTGLCSIAVTKGGRRLFESFGFQTSHGWRERGGQRYLCHARIADLHLADLHRRLRVHDALLRDVCVREGLTGTSKERLVGRC